MNKIEKEIVKHLVKKELNLIKSEEATIEFPSLDFLKSARVYEDELNKLLNKI
jgi:hypothetical protein